MRQLPPESATATAMRVSDPFEPDEDQPHDPEAEKWSRLEHLLATVVDEIRGLRYLTESVNNEGKPKWELTPVPRPGLTRKKKKISPQAAEFLWNLIKDQ